MYDNDGWEQDSPAMAKAHENNRIMDFHCSMPVPLCLLIVIACCVFQFQCDGTYFGARDFSAVPLLLHLEIYPATDAAGHLST